MDIKGKPKMSRELIERLSYTPSSTSQAFGVATGGVRTPSMDARRNVYRNSQLGQRYGVRQLGTEIGGSPHSGRKDMRPTLEHLPTNANRPSAGFREPPARGYNPYG